MTLFVVWLAFCALVFGVVAGGFNFDKLAVFFLRAIDAPVYPEARRVAGMVYQHPEQWTLKSSYYLKHQTIEVYACATPQSLYVSGEPFGNWEPTYIERRIIFDAVEWWKRVYVSSLVHKAIT